MRAALKFVTQLLDTGGLFVWKWPRGCQAWELPEMKMFQTRHGIHLLYSDMGACELGVRDETTRMLARKAWTFMTNSETLHKILNLRCSRHPMHVWMKETHSDNYPVKLCRHAVQHILRMERWNLVQHVLRQATMTQALTAESENSIEHDEAILSASPASETRTLELLIRKLHQNCAHPPNRVLVRMLRWKGANESVLAAGRVLNCSACEEAKPSVAKPVSAFHENKTPWRVVGCDSAEWNHPVFETRKAHLWICVDDATKFTVGHV